MQTANLWQRVKLFAAAPFALQEKLARGEAELYPYSTVTVNTTLSHQTCLDMLWGGAGEKQPATPVSSGPPAPPCEILSALGSDANQVL